MSWRKRWESQKFWEGDTEGKSGREAGRQWVLLSRKARLGVLTRACVLACLLPTLLLLLHMSTSLSDEN